MMSEAAIKFAHLGWESRFLHPRYWATWSGLALLYLYSLLPRWLRTRIAAVLGEVAQRTDRRRSHYVDVNLGLCFPQLSAARRQALARGYFRYYLQILFDLSLAWWGGERRLLRDLEIYGREHLESVRARGRNVILLTGHVIGLDFGVLALSRDYPMVSVYKPFKNRLADWLVFRARTRFGLKLVARDDGLRPVVRAVRQGDLLYYIPDEDLGPERSVFAPFFGVSKATLPTLGRLARLCDAEVIPCTTCFDAGSGKYRVILLPALREFPQGDEVADARRMNQALEQLLDYCPAQYMWGLRLFKTRPSGEAGLY